MRVLWALKEGGGAFGFGNAQMNATFIESASSIVLAVQNKKSGTVTTHKIAAIKVTTEIAVEADASPSLTEPLCSKEIQVHYAKQAQSGMVDNT